MRRRNVISLIVVAVVLFIVISALVARVVNVSGKEDSALTALVTAESRGNPGRVIALMHGCSQNAACRQRAATNAAALNHPGTISIIQIQASAGFSFGATTGIARVAWLAGNSLPRVQCVRVRRAGGLLEGYTIQLLVASKRIKSDTACPARIS